MLPDIVFIASGDARSEIVRTEATEKGNVRSNPPPTQFPEGARGTGVPD